LVLYDDMSAQRELFRLDRRDVQIVKLTQTLGSADFFSDHRQSMPRGVPLSVLIELIDLIPGGRLVT
jgi:hypothetical protein